MVWKRVCLMMNVHSVHESLDNGSQSEICNHCISLRSSSNNNPKIKTQGPDTVIAETCIVCYFPGIAAVGVAGEILLGMHW